MPSRSAGTSRHRVIAAIVAVLAPLGAAQAADEPGELVVYCRDPARGIITRTLASECRHETVSEAEFEASRDRSAERRRRILNGGARPAAPESPVPAHAAPARETEAPKPALSQPAPASRAETSKPAPSQPAPAAQPAGSETAGDKRGAAAKTSTAQGRTAPAASYQAPPPSMAGISAEVSQIVAAMLPGEFKAVSKNTVKDVAADCAALKICGSSGIKGLGYWDGAAFDTRRNELLLWGGGHTDYGGNEIYLFSLATLSWQRLTEPSPLRVRTGSDASKGEYESADGSEAPVSAHSYDGLLYLPGPDRYLVIPQSSYLNGSRYEWGAFLFDRESRKWKRGAKAPHGGYESSAELLPDGRVVVSHDTGIMVYDPAADTWDTLQARDNTGYGSAGAYHPETGLFVQAGNLPELKLVYYDLKQSNPTRRAAPLKGNMDWFEYQKRAGLAYRPVDGKLYLWAGGNHVWKIDPSTWQAAKYEAHGGPRYPSPPIWGKWLYVPALDVFVAMRSVSEPVWLYKPPTGNGDTADSSRSPTLQKVVDAMPAGGTLALPRGDFHQSVILRTQGTVRGDGTRLQFSVAGGKAAIVASADGLTIENVTVEDIDGGQNFAAVRVEKPNITIRGLKARRVQTGILSGNSGTGTITVENSEFTDILGGEYGQTHGVYFGFGERLVFRNSSIRHVDRGAHTFKARSKSGLVEGGVFAQLGGDASRSFDLSNGGEWILRGVIIQHGPRGNSDIIGYGHEYKRHPDAPDKKSDRHSLLVENSLIICDQPNCVLTTKRPEMPNPVFRNCTIVGVKLPAELDGGGNKVFASREAAGLPPYPAAEAGMLPKRQGSL